MNMANDHDILIQLMTKVDDMKTSVDNLTAARNAYITKDDFKEHMIKELDHEMRLRVLEKGQTQVMTYGAALVVALGIAQFIISKYL